MWLKMAEFIGYIFDAGPLLAGRLVPHYDFPTDYGIKYFVLGLIENVFLIYVCVSVMVGLFRCGD